MKMSFNFWNMFSKIQKESKELNKKINNTQIKIEKEHDHQLDEFEKAKKRFESHN